MTNIPTDQINQIRALLDQSQEVLITIPKNPNLDDMASALSLYLALSSRGKRVQTVCTTPATVEFSHLIGIDKVKNGLNGGNGKNLVISFPYQEGSIEKVSYNIENDTFNLVIEPREGYPMVTEDSIRYSYSGGNIDLIITVGTSKLSDLDSVYTNNQSLFSDKALINIDSRAQNQRFGRINIIDTNVSGISELVTSLLSLLGFTIDSDIATNLIYGITFGSQNFSSSTTTAATFEAAALCLKNGARKPSQLYQPKNEEPVAFPQPKTPKPVPSKSQTLPFGFPPRPIVGKTQQDKPTASFSPPVKDNSETPPDWLKPKIYKGSTLL